MHHLLAQQFGTITNPFNTLGGPSSLQNSNYGSGLVSLLGVFFKTAIVLAGIYTLLNFLLAGFSFISAGGDPKNVEKAWSKIWQSLIGLLVVAGSIILAIIIGYLIFGSANALLLVSPRVFAP